MTSDPLGYEPGPTSVLWTSLCLPVWNYEEINLSSPMLILPGILSQWWRKSLSCSVSVEIGEFQRGRITFQKHMLGCGLAIQFWVLVSTCKLNWTLNFPPVQFSLMKTLQTRTIVLLSPCKLKSRMVMSISGHSPYLDAQVRKWLTTILIPKAENLNCESGWKTD